MKFFFGCLVLIIVPLFGEIEHYFEKNIEKTPLFQIRNIDYLYMINLEERPEKLSHTLKQLHSYGIEPARVSAVNGWELSLETINELGIRYETWMDSNGWGTSYLTEERGFPFHDTVHVPGRTYFCHHMARGTIGIVLSHLSVLQNAWDAGHETIWVIEDDIMVIRNPHVLSDYIDQLDAAVGKQGWDILFTDRDTKDKQGNYIPCFSYAWRPNYKPENPGKFLNREIVENTFLKIGARYGAYSMIIRRSGMKKILDFIKTYHIFLPYDMEYTQPPNIKLYSILDDVVSTQIDSLSDNGEPNYKKKEMR